MHKIRSNAAKKKQKEEAEEEEKEIPYISCEYLVLFLSLLLL